MSEKTDAFIRKHKNDVILSTKGTGLFPSVKMAQMIIESSWGLGTTAVKANNFFGIKADKNYKGEKMQFNTPKDGKPISFFRVYKQPLDSIKDHSKFLIENSRYRKNGVFNAKTPEQQIEAIAKSGYAEAKNYVPALTNLINAYNLKALDSEIISEPTLNEGTKETVKKVKENPVVTVVLVAVVLVAGYVLYKTLTTKTKK